MESVDAIAFTEIARASPRTVVWTSGADSFGFGYDQRDGVRLQFVVVNGEKPPAGVQVLQEADVDHHRFDFGVAFGDNVLLVDVEAEVERRSRNVREQVLAVVDLDVVGHVEGPVWVGVGQNLLGALVRAGDAVQNVGLVEVPVRELEFGFRALIDVSLAQSVVHSTALDELDEVVLRDARRHVPAAVNREIGAPRQCEIEPDEGGLLVAELGVPELVRRYGGRVQAVQFPEF